MNYEGQNGEDTKIYDELLENFEVYLTSSGLAVSTVKRHLYNISMFLYELLLFDDVTDMEEGIYLLDSYFHDIIGEIYHTVSLYTVNANITSLRKFYLFLEEGEVVPPGTYNQLNAEIMDKKDGWLMQVQGIRPEDSSYGATRLFQLVKEYMMISPWTYLGDMDIFAVEFSDEKDAFFCVILGNDVGPYGLVVYRGSPGLLSLFKFLEGSDEVLENPLAFADYMALELRDREKIRAIDYGLIKKSGITFRGRNSWPSFIICEPGYAPQLPHDNELRLMERILSVINPFLATVISNPEMVRLFPEGKMLLRRYDKNNEFISEDVMDAGDYLVSNPLLEKVPVAYDNLMLSNIQRVAKKSKALWEVDISFVPDPLDVDGKSIFLAMLMVVDKGSRRVLHTDYAGPDSLEDLQLAFLKAIEKHKTIPGKVHIPYTKSNNYLYDMLVELSIKVEMVVELEVIPLRKKMYRSHYFENKFF